MENLHKQQGCILVNTENEKGLAVFARPEIAAWIKEERTMAVKASETSQEPRKEPPSTLALPSAKEASESLLEIVEKEDD
jgi:hypothetical protein